MPLYSGRIRANSFFNGPSEYGHPIRCAITGAGILGHTRSSARICGSNASTTDPRATRRYVGGRSEDNAARTVFRATPSRRAISLIGTPSARCKRRISAQSSTFSTLQDLGGGQFSEYPRGSFFRVRRQGVQSVQPRLVADVTYRNVTRKGRLRHPSYKGLRPDRDPHEAK